MFGWPFRSTRDHIDMLREIRKPAPDAVWALPANTTNETAHVSADFSAKQVTLKIGGVTIFWDRDVALTVAADIKRAAEALPDEAVDITAELEAKEDGE